MISTADANELVKLLKQASVEATEAAKPVHFCFGKVISTSPLQIDVEQKMTLGKNQLLVPQHLTDYDVKITGKNIQDWYYLQPEEDDETETVDPVHVHAIGTIEITIHNALETGDEVIMARQQEGQKYIVIDRIGVTA